MAERKTAEDDFNPRHRIVGAVVLVALAVIFIPLLLSDRPPEPEALNPTGMLKPDTKTVVVPVTPPGTKPVVVPTPVTPDASKSAASKTVVVPVDPSADIPTTQSMAPPAPEVVSPAPKPETEKTIKSAKTGAPAKSAPVAASGWTVQVGAFSQLDNAKRLQEKLKKKGFSATLDPPTPAKGKTVRVEVGPYKNASAAQSAQARIENEFGIKGVVRKP